jgi:hypothetical protein
MTLFLLLSSLGSFWLQIAAGILWASIDYTLAQTGQGFVRAVMGAEEQR